MQDQRSKQAYRLVVKHYWQETLKNWRDSLPALILPGIGSIFASYIPPLVIAKLLTDFTNETLPDTESLVPYLILFGGSWLIGELLWRVGIYFMIRNETKSVQSLSSKAMQQLLRKDLVFFHENFAGSLTKKTTGYFNRYIDVLDTLTYNVISYLIPVFFAFWVLWQFSPWLALGLVGWVGMIILIIIPMIRYRKKLVVVREAASTALTGHIADVYGNIDAVKTFAHENSEQKRHNALTKDYTKKMGASWDFQNRRIDMTISPFYVATNVFGIIMSIYIAKISSLPLATIFITFTYYSLFTRFLWEFNGVYRRLESAISDAAQFTELLIDEPIVVDIAKPKPFSVVRGKIEFSSVTFGHDEEEGILFDGLNLRIKPGEKVGLVGHSGGGKSSLMKLIMRLKDVQSGVILVDDQNIAEAKQSELRKYLSYVPQDPVMFHRTLAENIAYGRQDATQQEIEIAAKMAHAHDFISDLSKGYETLVGERGVKLSGGQRQRVAIARAMLKNAPVLLLDEATSALDSESEALIQDALFKLMEGKTAIVIAHRLSTIQKMDRILVLESGEIVEEGTHKELIRNDGIYAELWKHQSGGFLED